MANIPLLYWAARETGDDSYRFAAEAHALSTQRDFVRADQSSYHAVEYALPAGTRARGFTFQGYADESCWSRGQAWGIYGFVASYAATGRRAHLQQAERLAETGRGASATTPCRSGISTIRPFPPPRATALPRRSRRPRFWTWRRCIGT